MKDQIRSLDEAYNQLRSVTRNFSEARSDMDFFYTFGSPCSKMQANLDKNIL